MQTLDIKNKTMIKKIKNLQLLQSKFTSKLMITALLFTTVSCVEEVQLPEAGSIADLTPPSAAFTYAASEADHLTIEFSNQSKSATEYTWDFGDGTNSTDANPSKTFSAIGDYNVSLTARDALGISNTTTSEVNVVEPVVEFTPVILNPSFDEEGSDSYRDGWRNSALGGVIQITSSPVRSSPKAAKFPSAGDRIAYQLITVLPNTDYRLSFYYTMKTSPAGSLTVAILGGAVNDPNDVAGATIASGTFNDQSSASTYVGESVSFNSGDNTEIAIFVSNVGVESRLDDFTIEQQ